MHVRVGVRLSHRSQMLMLVMLVVHMQMLVLQLFMAMKVLMVLQGQGGDTHDHQRSGEQSQQVGPISEQGNGENRADEGSRCENRCLPRRSQDAQGLHVQNQAQTVAEGPHQ